MQRTHGCGGLNILFCIYIFSFSSFFSCSRLRGIVIAEYLWTGASCMLHVLDAGAADPYSTFHSLSILPLPASPPSPSTYHPHPKRLVACSLRPFTPSRPQATSTTGAWIDSLPTWTQDTCLHLRYSTVAKHACRYIHLTN